MKPDSAISAIRPSMIALVSTTMWGSPGRPASSSGLRPPEEPERLGGRRQVLPLGDRQADHAEPQDQRDRQRQPVAERWGQVRQRHPEQQAHQQADEEADHRRDELRRGQRLDLADDPAGPGRS